MVIDIDDNGLCHSKLKTKIYKTDFKDSIKMFNIVAINEEGRLTV